MLKYRLIFGTLMTLFFVAAIIFGGWIDGSLTVSAADDKAVQGSVLFILICLLMIPAQLEFSKLTATRGIKIFLPVSIPASILFAGGWYWGQLFDFLPPFYMSFLTAIVLLILFIYQYARYGTEGVIANCGANLFSIIYLGLLSSFVLAIRIDFGLWELLMFVFVVKCSDIGAYTLGKLFGKHKFAPKISPGKTWEGMAGAVIASIIVSLLFSINCGIMSLWQAVVFGICFAFAGQLADLAESMIKRDSEQKDSANSVPGFGGILDVIDSPLASACLAYLFFSLTL